MKIQDHNLISKLLKEIYELLPAIVRFSKIKDFENILRILRNRLMQKKDVRTPFLEGIILENIFLKILHRYLFNSSIVSHVYKDDPFYFQLRLNPLQHSWRTASHTLFNIAKFYLKMHEYGLSAKYSNAALAIYKAEKLNLPEYKKTLKQFRSYIVLRFVQEKLKDFVPAINKKQWLKDTQAKIGYSISKHKAYLSMIRAEVKKITETLNQKTTEDYIFTKKIEELLKFISASMRAFLINIIQDCMVFFGEKNPPCSYAFVSMGSLARREMTPFSDIEYFILLERNDFLSKEYFYNLSQLFELEIINLGETCLGNTLNLMPLSVSTLLKKAVSIDLNKNPAANNLLLGTPQEILHFQKSENFIHQEINHLSVSLRNVDLLICSENGEYLLSEYLGGLIKLDNNQKSIGKDQVLKILQNDYLKYFPGQCYNSLLKVKYSFYRFFTVILDDLAFYFELKSRSTYERINELFDLKYLDETTCLDLKLAFSIINFLRLKVYYFYNSQTDYVLNDQSLINYIDFNKLGLVGSNKKLYITSEAEKEAIKTVEKIITSNYEKIIPLIEGNNFFLQSKNHTLLHKASASMGFKTHYPINSKFRLNLGNSSCDLTQKITAPERKMPNSFLFYKKNHKEKISLSNEYSK